MPEEADDLFELWSARLEFDMPFELFERLPRPLDYRYEYANGRAELSQAPRYVELTLDLDAASPLPASRRSRDVRIRRLRSEDWLRLPPLLASAFCDVSPFAMLPPDKRGPMAEAWMARTRAGEEGRLVDTACVVATSDEPDERGDGVAIVTLVESSRFLYREALPGGGTREELVPHLTWIFVHPFKQRHGLGAALLAATTAELRLLGHRELMSTTTKGNSASLLWHWRRGFRLIGGL